MRDRKHDIERYLKGELTSAEMHALEKEALHDPFLAEALEGVEEAGKDNFLFDLHNLNRSVHDRARKRKARSVTMWGWPTGIAATLLLIAVSGYLVVSLINDQNTRRHAMQEQAPAAGDLIHTDSATVGSGAIAQTQEAEEETAPQPQTPAPRTSQPPRREAKDPVAREEKPIDDQLALEKQLLVEGEGEKDTAEKIEAVREQFAIADIEQAETKQEQDATLDVSKRKRDGSELAGTDSRAKAAGVPPRSLNAPAAATESLVVKGKVRSDDGQALPGVNVMVKGTKIGAVTDAMGNYQLTIPAGNTSLVFAFIGFATQEVAVAGQPEINVQLSEDVNSLSEVVIVSGSGSDNGALADKTYQAAEPERGRSEFRDYLEKSVKYPEEAVRNKTEGKVTVRFTVEPSGQLSGFEILKGIGSGCDEALIRAIREGPSWKPAKQGERAIAEQVRVRYRFELPK